MLEADNYPRFHKRHSLCCTKDNNRIWKLRNDSSGVNGILCPDYFRSSPQHKSKSISDMASSSKILITSKKHREEPKCRKPIKECYCHSQERKVSQVDRRPIKSLSLCDHYKSQHDTKSIAIRHRDEEEILPTSPISCETLRRIQEIDYIPRSQFLRNVQSKISLVRKYSSSDVSQKCSRTHCQENLQDRNDISWKTNSCQLSKNFGNTYRLYRSDSLPDVTNHDESSTIDAKHKCKSMHSNSKLLNKKTIFSKRTIPGQKRERSLSRLQSRSRKNLPENNENYCCNCCSKIHGLTDDELTNKETSKHRGQPECCRDTNCLNHETKYLNDHPINELRKFRDQNYFDTHGSKHTLSTSVSSGSLQQCYLNERLFPEPIKKVHKNELVVTMPPCATKQGKRIHYFPRYVVWQNKNANSGGKKKRRCQGCPLTGHAVDLGILKTNLPCDSLALKYQKRLP